MSPFKILAVQKLCDHQCFRKRSGLESSCLDQHQEEPEKRRIYSVSLPFLIISPAEESLDKILGEDKLETDLNFEKSEYENIEYVYFSTTPA